MSYFNYKKSVTILGLIIGSLILCKPCVLSAQGAAENASEVLKKMNGAIESMGAMALEFSVNLGTGVKEDYLLGSAEVQGNSFKMVSPDFEIFCDGISKWILNVNSDELTILPNDTAQTDMLENPVGFLKSLSNEKSSGYKYPQKASSSADGKQWHVEMTPSAKNSLCKSLKVSLDKSSYLPRSIIYTGADGSTYEIELTTLKKMVERSGENFVFPADRMKGLQVNDLR